MEKKTVKIGGVQLGAGRCAVCIPVMGDSLEALHMSAQRAKSAGADLIELRADSLCAMPDAALAQQMCACVRNAAPGLPLLFTLRTARDGGAGDADSAAYEALLCALISAGKAACDAIDVELSAGEDAFARIAQAAKHARLAVIGSSHDFDKTPDEVEICSRLSAMQRLGADVCKIAVMPHSRLDVISLMRAAAVSDEALRAPVIAIAMGPLGVMTRVCGEAFGSCLTFGTAGQASAPGQIDAKQLRGILEVIHNSL